MEDWIRAYDLRNKEDLYDRQLRFLEEYFSEVICDMSDDLSHVTVIIDTPALHKMIQSDRFMNDYRESGFTKMTMDLSYVENPSIDYENKIDYGLGFKPRLRERDFNDRLTFYK